MKERALSEVEWQGGDDLDFGFIFTTEDGEEWEFEFEPAQDQSTCTWGSWRRPRVKYRFSSTCYGG